MYKSKVIQHSFFHCAILGLFFLFAELIINPIGNFALNDEWLYAKMVFDFNQYHSLDTSKWGYTSMLTHLLYGHLVVSVFGCSYVILHLSTLPLALAGIICYYYLLRDFVVKNSISAFLLSLLVLANPLYLSLSNSFMTDIPFISTLIIALYFYLKYKTSNTHLFLGISMLFCVWSILIRQLGFAFVLGIFVSEILIDKRKIWSGLILMLTALLSLWAFEYWLSFKHQSNGYSYLYFGNGSRLNSEVITSTIINFSKRWVHYISFTGFVLAPLLITKLFFLVKRNELFKHKLVLALTIVLYIPVLWSMQKFPIGNYFYNTGVGAETLYDTYILQLNTQHSYSVIFSIIKVASYIGSFVLLFILVSYAFEVFKNGTQIKNNNYSLLAISFALFFYYSFLALASPIFDRYILVFSIFIVPFVIHNTSISLNGWYLFLISLLAIFSVLATKDYFEGHRTRWKAINFLRNECHISDEQINGGLEHESTVFYKRIDWFNKWRNIPKNDYVISYGPINGYSKFVSYPYQRYIPYKIDTIFVLKNNEIK